MSSPTEGPLLRAVIDTNIIVRAVLSPTGGAAVLWQCLKERRFTPIASRHQLAELYRVLGYPRIVKKYGVAQRLRRRAVVQLYSRSVIVFPNSVPAICRDPHDDYLIANALLGGATHLVTEDKDLLDESTLVETLKGRGVETVGLAEFLRVVRETG